MLGERGEQRVALEHLGVGRAEHRQLEEVVHHHDGVEPAGVGFFRLLHDDIEQTSAVGAGVGEVRDLVAESRHGANLRRASEISARDGSRGAAGAAASGL